MIDHRHDGIGLDLLHQIGRRILAEINSAPARHEHQRAIIGGILLIFAELGLRLVVGLVDDDSHEIIGQDLARIAPGFGRLAPHVRNVGLEYRFDRRRHEDAFRMLGREGLACAGRAGLIQQRRALGRRLAEVKAGDVEILSLVSDLMNLGRIRENTPIGVAQDRPFLPAALEQLVEHLDIFGRNFIAIVVPAQSALSDVLRAALQVGRHDVPADTPLGVMVRGRKPARESVGMLERGRRRDADAEMLGRERNGRRQLQGIVDRNLGCLLQRMKQRLLIDIVVADHIGDEDAVEDAALQRAAEILPVVEILVFVGAVSRMRPQARRLMPDTIHVERVEPDLTHHCSAPVSWTADNRCLFRPAKHQVTSYFLSLLSLSIIFSRSLLVSGRFE